MVHVANEIAEEDEYARLPNTLAERANTLGAQSNKIFSRSK